MQILGIAALICVGAVLFLCALYAAFYLAWRVLNGAYAMLLIASDEGLVMLTLYGVLWILIAPLMLVISIWVGHVYLKEKQKDEEQLTKPILEGKNHA